MPPLRAVKPEPVLRRKGICVERMNTTKAAVHQTTQEKQNTQKEPAFLRLSLLWGFYLSVCFMFS